MIRVITIILCISSFLTIIQPDRADALIASHQCTYCHSPHLAAGDTLLNDASVEALCLSCHGIGGISILPKVEVHTNSTVSGYSFRQTCLDCHNPHDNLVNRTGGKNIELVGVDLERLGFARISTPHSGIRHAVFENRTTFTQGAPYYDGVCETCHTLTRFHRNNSSGTHNHQVGTNCTKCHTHVNYFLPPKRTASTP